MLNPRRTIAILVNNKWIVIRSIEWESAQSLAWELNRSGVKWWSEADSKWHDFIFTSSGVPAFG